MLRRLRMLLALLLVIATASAWVASYGQGYRDKYHNCGRFDPPAWGKFSFGEWNRHFDFMKAAVTAPSLGHSVFCEFGVPQKYAGLWIRNGMLVARAGPVRRGGDELRDASVYQVSPILSCCVNPEDRTGRKDVEIIVKLWFLFLVSVAWLCGNIYRGPLRYWRRLKRGLCVSCGYDLRGTESGVCSECGKEIRVQKRT